MIVECNLLLLNYYRQVASQNEFLALMDANMDIFRHEMITTLVPRPPRGIGSFSNVSKQMPVELTSHPKWLTFLASMKQTLLKLKCSWSQLIGKCLYRKRSNETIASTLLEKMDSDLFRCGRKRRQ